MIEKLVIGWLINWAIAWVTRWLDQNQPTARIQKGEPPAPIVKPKPKVADPIEHLDPKSPDAAPPGRPPKISHKLPPVDWRPNRWNRETGTFNK